MRNLPARNDGFPVSRYRMLTFSSTLLVLSTITSCQGRSHSTTQSTFGVTTPKKTAISIDVESTNSIIRSLRAGGSGGKRKKKKSSGNHCFASLAQVLKDDFPECQLDQLTQSLTKLANSQGAFKSLDGMAHEAYQRTHINGAEVDTSVAGRAQRSAARVAATAEALWACELVEILDLQLLSSQEASEEESSLSAAQDTKSKEEGGDSEKDEAVSLSCNGNRIEILYNSKSDNNSSDGDKSEGKKGCITLGKSKFSVLVLYEEDYDRGAGLDHGSIMSFPSNDDRPTSNNKEKKGRFLVVLDDSISEDLVETLQILAQKPKRVKLSTGLIAGEVVSVQPQLYKAAGQVLQLVEPYLRDPNRSKAAIHFVGRSLAGGVASLAATILDGSIPIPKGKAASDNKTKSRSKSKTSTTQKENKRVEKEVKVDATGPAEAKNTGADDKDDNDEREEETIHPIMTEPLNGLGRARSSALSLGAPPCLSGNVVAAYCTSFVYGDDIVSRTTHETLDHLRGRVEKTVKGGFIGQNLGLVSDTLSLTMAGFKTHAHGSEGEEIKLSIPGKAYLVRPRRLGGACSIHEVGNLQKGGREALRANLLWQLNDILLSKSMWKHHDLESYIQGLDRVHLRSSSESDDSLL